MGPIALVREVSAAFVDCVTANPPSPPLDAGVARRQHAAYTAALADHGFTVEWVTPAPDLPDGCFVEDTAVVIDDAALLTVPGHPNRRRETASVGGALERFVAVERMAAPATLDGGDVLQVGSTVFVGVGSRTNADGIAALARFAVVRGRRVVPVHTSGVLHLKSAATALDDETVLVHPASVETDAFSGIRTVPVVDDDPEAANVVRLPDGTLLASSAFPGTADRLESLGHRVSTVDVSEIARADGGLTCLSIRLRKWTASPPLLS
ncbi:MAG: arginine deiminase family protein [Acidimicrobiia bacterium]